MSDGGRVRVVVTSRKVPTRSVELKEPIFDRSGAVVGAARRRVLVYDLALDEGHRRAIEEGRRISCTLGLDLEVVYRSKLSAVRKALSSILRTPALPSLVVTPYDSRAPPDR